MNVAITSLETLRNLVARVLIVLTALHVPPLIAIAAVRGFDVTSTAVAAIAFAAVPALLYRLGRPNLIVAYAVTVGLVGQTSLLVFLMKGHPWQIEMHFYYFAVLAMLSGFCGWRTIVLGAGLIAIQHLSLNWLMPEAIYAGGGDIGRVLVHAWIVVAESGMLIAIGIIIQQAFAEVDKTRAEAERSAAELERVAGARETMLAETTAHAAETRALLDRFETEMSAAIDVLHTSASGLMGNADRLGASSAKTSAQVVTVLATSEETSRTVEMVAAAGQELARTINDVGVSAARSSTLAASAVTEAERTSRTMDEMAAVSAEIGAVTGLISGIAEQTNLLALNATIEAARAGEAGRGFSVVAQEVKALANQTAKATQDIAQRVAAMQDTSNRSVAAIHAVSSKIRELDQVANSIARAVDEQVSGTEGIAENVNACATGVGHVEKSIATIEQLAETNAQDVVQVNEAAQQVALQTQKIRERVHAFTADIERLRA
jgi:methyl-accepting chemotaxis protein